MKRSLILCALAIASTAGAGEVRMTFDANNEPGTVEFVAQRKPAFDEWADMPMEVASGPGTVVGETSIESGAIMATWSDFTVESDADFFLDERITPGKQIAFDSGEVVAIVGINGPRTVVVSPGEGDLQAQGFIVRTDRVELVDRAVPPGSWTYRVFARTVSGKVSTFTNDATTEVAPFGPGSLQVVNLGGLANLSARAVVGRDAEIMIGGIVTRSRTKILARGVGPGLNRFNIPRTLADPRLTLFKGQTPIASNDNWNEAEISAAADSVFAFRLDPGSTDSALLVDLDPGSFTVHLTGSDGGSGVALLELYEVTR